MEPGKEKIEQIRADLESKRNEWRNIRDLRLRRKRFLEAEGSDRASIRKDREHRDLQKKQDRLAKVIRHIEKRLNRKTARLTGEGAKT